MLMVETLFGLAVLVVGGSYVLLRRRQACPAA
jgi:LPXTG-motif cell wall-anchored protein